MGADPSNAVLFLSTVVSSLRYKFGKRYRVVTPFAGKQGGLLCRQGCLRPWISGEGLDFVPAWYS